LRASITLSLMSGSVSRSMIPAKSRASGRPYILADDIGSNLGRRGQNAKEFLPGSRRKSGKTAVDALVCSPIVHELVKIQLGPDHPPSSILNQPRYQRRSHRHSSSAHSVRFQVGGSLQTCGSAIGVTAGVYAPTAARVAPGLWLPIQAVSSSIG
jgi:hypothetical protein